MNKLLIALTVSVFMATSFAAVAQDNPIGPEQTAARKETAKSEIKKEMTSQHGNHAKLDKKYTAAHRNGKTISSKRRPMFK